MSETACNDCGDPCREEQIIDGTCIWCRVDAGTATIEQVLEHIEVGHLHPGFHNWAKVEQMIAMSETLIQDEAYWDAKSDAWMAKYRPVDNPSGTSGGGSYMIGDTVYDYGIFETYGEDLDFVRAQPNANVWTLTECDGSTWICAGYHVVNRQGYLITEFPWDIRNRPDDICDWDEEWVTGS